MKSRNVRTIRNAQRRGKKVVVRTIPAEAMVHRKGSAAAKAATVFKGLFSKYVAGKVKRQVLVERAAKRADISPATASTYLHNFSQAALAQ